MRSLLSDMLADALRRGRSFCGFCDWAGVIRLRLQAERELHLIYRNPFRALKGCCRNCEALLLAYVPQAVGYGPVEHFMVTSKCATYSELV